ncbi:uncharacterized protein VTP21DRAFT_6486 [Calcarisporiella thermophila]|uniref:uncharacterized protein n=1 Tax=Calcarisporiella thermophila TaxID=911321 RepID=UPI0037431824
MTEPSNSRGKTRKKFTRVRPHPHFIASDTQDNVRTAGSLGSLQQKSPSAINQLGTEDWPTDKQQIQPSSPLSGVQKPEDKSTLNNPNTKRKKTTINQQSLKKRKSSSQSERQLGVEEPSIKRNPQNHTEICKFFRSYSCVKGESCPYSHDLKQEPCRFFHLKKYCEKGSSCRFSHDLLSDEERQKFIMDLSKRTTDNENLKETPTLDKPELTNFAPFGVSILSNANP